AVVGFVPVEGGAAVAALEQGVACGQVEAALGPGPAVAAQTALAQQWGDPRAEVVLVGGAGRGRRQGQRDGQGQARGRHRTPPGTPPRRSESRRGGAKGHFFRLNSTVLPSSPVAMNSSAVSFLMVMVIFCSLSPSLRTTVNFSPSTVKVPSWLIS